jgi:hypothetical protein
MDLKTLRASRNTDFSKIASEFEKTNNPETTQKSYTDDRFWKPERDKAGNASATIRFLPRTVDKVVGGEKHTDELPWVKIFSHGFQGPTGRWYIENSLSTLGQNDPVGELNARLWNSTTDDNSPARKQARAQKRKLNYIANVLVVSDPKHPENNGKVLLFKFGKKIFDKLMDKARPSFEDEDPVNVFDYWEGANFKLRMKQVDGYPNYDASTFEDVSPVAGSDEEILAIANAQHWLGEFTQPANFKSYDELKRKLELVLSGASAATSSAMNDATSEDMPSMAAREPVARQAPAPKAAKSAVDEDDDDMMSYFQKLAND